MQRNTVYKENGVVKAFNFSVIDVFKGKDIANDNHGSKIMVLPFDEIAFGKHFEKLIYAENKQILPTPLPLF